MGIELAARPTSANAKKESISAAQSLAQAASMERLGGGFGKFLVLVESQRKDELGLLGFRHAFNTIEMFREVGSNKYLLPTWVKDPLVFQELVRLVKEMTPTTKIAQSLNIGVVTATKWVGVLEKYEIVERAHNKKTLKGNTILKGEKLLERKEEIERDKRFFEMMLEENGFIKLNDSGRRMGKGGASKIRNHFNGDNSVRSIMISTGTSVKGQIKYSSFDFFGCRLQEQYLVKDMEAFSRFATVHIENMFRAKNPSPDKSMRAAFSMFMHKNQLHSSNCAHQKRRPEQQVVSGAFAIQLLEELRKEGYKIRQILQALPEAISMRGDPSRLLEIMILHFESSGDRIVTEERLDRWAREILHSLLSKRNVPEWALNPDFFEGMLKLYDSDARQAKMMVELRVTYAALAKSMKFAKRMEIIQERPKAHYPRGSKRNSTGSKELLMDLFILRNQGYTDNEISDEFKINKELVDELFEHRNLNNAP